MTSPLSLRARLEPDFSRHASLTPAIEPDRLALQAAAALSLQSQRQQSSEPVLQEVLQEIKDSCLKALPNNLQLTDGSKPPSPETICEVTTLLKQDALYALDQKTGAYFASILSQDIARPLQLALQSEYRLQFLESQCSQATDPFQLSCLKEHLIATRQQLRQADRAMLTVRLPELIPKLKNMLKTQEDNQRKAENLLQTTLTDNLRYAISEVLAINKMDRESLKKLQSTDTDLLGEVITSYQNRQEEIAATFRQEKLALETLYEVLKSGEPVDIPSDMLPDILCTDLTILNAGCKAQIELKVEITQLTDILTGEGTAPREQELHQRLNTLTDKLRMMEKERDRLTALVDRGGIVRDLSLKFRRWFGLGGVEKTRAENQVLLTKCGSTLQKTGLQIIQLNDQITQYRKQIPHQVTVLQSKLDTLGTRQHELKESLQETIGKYLQQKEQTAENLQTALQMDYHIQRDRLDADEMRRDKLIEETETRIRRLEKLSCGDLIGSVSFPLLCEHLNGHASFEKIKGLHEDLRQMQLDSGSRDNVISVDALIQRCENLQHSLSLPVIVVSDDEISGVKEEINSLGLSVSVGGLPLPAEVREGLAHSAALFALRCVEKVQAHSVSYQVREAEVLTPKVLKQLNVLESRLGAGSSSHQSGSTQRVSEHIQGLRRIVSQQHPQAEACAIDFTAQYYHEGAGLYLDRQYNHGTCVMHSWNNLMAYLTDNREMILTPFRMEKLIQSSVVQSANQHLEELLARPGVLKTNVVEAVLKEVIRISELVLPGRLAHFQEHGHVMDYVGESPVMVESNHLNYGSRALFDNAGIPCDGFDGCVFGASVPADEQAHFLDILSGEDHDAFFLSFQGHESGVGHALCLLKDGDNYLLADSNYDDPVPLTLPALARFMSTGTTGSELLDRELLARDYQEYSLMILRNGFYKKERKV